MPWAVGQATDEQLDQVIEQLRVNLAQSESGRGFYHNRNIIADRHRQVGGVYVITDCANARVEAFVAGDIETGSLDILEVWSELRQAGRGRALVERFEMEARRECAFGCQVLCEPRNSLAFWERLGYVRPCGKSEPDGARPPSRYKPFSVTPTLPSGGSSSNVRIELMEDDTWEPGSSGVIHESTAVHLNGSHWLTQPLVIAVARLPLVRISIDGEVVYDDSVRKAESLGIERSGPFIRIETISADMQ